ncbi:Deoxyribose operon repressor, DeoR family [Raoultella ornithinolytica]|nr:Deoxyribose operon repressor, DeoR family [Raoultella ornithinolytica]
MGPPRPWIIDAIDNALPFTGVCYSLNTFLALQEKTPVSGHSLRAASSMPAMPFLNHSACRIRSAICARTSPFIPRPGIDCAQGATCYNLEELPVKHWAMSSARYHVLVVDHSKFGKVRPARMGDLSRFDVIASDVCPDEDLLALAKEKQISLLY